MTTEQTKSAVSEFREALYPGNHFGVVNSKGEALITALEQVQDELAQTRKSLARNLSRRIDAICDKCAHETTDDGCAFCIGKELEQAQRELKEVRGTAQRLLEQAQRELKEVRGTAQRLSDGTTVLRGEREQAHRERDEAITALHDVFEMASGQRSNRGCPLQGIVRTAKSAVRIIREAFDKDSRELQGYRDYFSMEGTIAAWIEHSHRIQDWQSLLDENKRLREALHKIATRVARADGELTLIDIARQALNAEATDTASTPPA